MFQKSMNKIIPLGLHGDGVPCAATREIPWSTCIGVWLLTQLPPGFCSQLFPNSAMLGRKSWDYVLQVFAWSMQQLALGFWPRSGHPREAWANADKATAKICVKS